MGLFQFVPLAKVSRRLEALRQKKMAEVRDMNLEPLKPDIQPEGKYKPGERMEIGGCVKYGILYSEFSGGERVRDHERQHMLFELYTGLIIRDSSLGLNNFYENLLSVRPPFVAVKDVEQYGKTAHVADCEI
jgi:hypothetical protein